MPPLSGEERAILDLETDTVAGHTVKLVGVRGDGSPASIEAVRERIAGRLEATPLLRRRLVESGSGEPEWADDGVVDLDAQVTPLELHGERSLRDAVGELFAGRLDRSLPLWDVHVAADDEGHTWVVWRIHHALADGSTFMGILHQALFDAEPAGSAAAGPPAGAVSHREARPSVPAALRHELRPSLRQSPFDGHITGRRAVAFGATSLHALHDGARRAVPGATLNDALLTAVGGGLRRWLEVHHDHLGSVRIKVPVSLHDPAGDDQGNHDSFFSVDLPVSEADPVERLRHVQASTALSKREQDAEAVDEMLNSLRRASPRLARFADHALGHPREFALNVSNVKGPRTIPSVLGAPVVALHTLAEIGGRHALRVAAVSLGDVLSVGFCSDPTLVGELDPLVAGFEDDAELLASRPA